MKLVKPDIKYRESYESVLEESKDQTGDTIFAKPAHGESFEQFVRRLNDESEGINIKPERVRASTYWLIDNEEVIGRVQIRHSLNERLRMYGGHIGYIVRPSKRRMGYGKKLLQMGLVEAKKIGIKNALVTCDIGNTASSKIITSNGGILQEQTEIDNGRKINRYLISVD